MKNLTELGLVNKEILMDYRRGETRAVNAVRNPALALEKEADAFYQKMYDMLNNPAPPDPSNPDAVPPPPTDTDVEGRAVEYMGQASQLLSEKEAAIKAETARQRRLF